MMITLKYKQQSKDTKLSSLTEEWCKEKVVTMTKCIIENIFYHRGILDHTYFESCSADGLDFVRFSPYTNHWLIAELRNFYKGASDAIQKEYLKELVMSVSSPFADNQINYEKYRLCYQYSKSPKNISQEQVIKSSASCLLTIKQLLSEAFGSLPPLKDLHFSFELIYYDHVPDEYVAPNFDKKYSQRYTKINRNPDHATFRLGQVKTPHLRIKCHAEAIPMEPSESESDDYDYLNIRKYDTNGVFNQVNRDANVSVSSSEILLNLTPTNMEDDLVIDETRSTIMDDEEMEPLVL